MCFLPVCIICIHPWISPIMIKSGSCQLLHRICSSRPGGSGEQYGQKVATFSRAYSWGLYCFQPQGSPASSCWPVLCVSLSARTESMPADFAKVGPSQVSSLAGEISSGSWRTLRERSSVRAVARTAGMHFSRSSERQISNAPHSPSRITVGWIKEIQNFFIVPCSTGTSMCRNRVHEERMLAEAFRLMIRYK